MYSRPSDLITSTMKSDPVRSAVSTSTSAGVSISASGAAGSGNPVLGPGKGSPTDVPGVEANTAAPAAAFF